MSNSSQAIAPDPNLEAIAAALRGAKPDNPMSLDQTEAIFALGCQMMDVSKFEEAALCFEFISDYSAADGKVWFCLGKSLQKLDRHEAALRSYLMALALQPSDPVVLLSMAECFAALGLRGHAGQAGMIAAVLAEKSNPAVAGRAKGLVDVVIH
jgi:tetratricopeptide (TPR) repeat protein